MFQDLLMVEAEAEEAEAEARKLKSEMIVQYPP